MAATKKIASANAVQASPDQATPAYWAEACKHLVKKDRVMKRLIPQFGDAALQTRRDAFTTLARSIVGQQSSVKAAQAVWERFAALSRTLSPAHVLKLKVDDMRAAGLSARKIDYLVDLALHFDNGKLHVKDWESMEDEAIIAELVDIRGIGRWTAEMFLIFYLQRPNVLRLKVDDMRAAGLSARKVEYLVDLALHFDSGTVHVKSWESMDDEAIIAELVAIRGIGRWTAEMFLIFHLLRPNVLPLDDIGLLNGISQNYFSGEQVSRSDAREVAEAWKPWCSVATWYIWRSLDPAPTAD